MPTLGQGLLTITNVNENYSILLTNETVAIATDLNGNNPQMNGASTTVLLTQGTTAVGTFYLRTAAYLNDTANKNPNNGNLPYVSGCTVSVVGTTIAFTGLTLDTGYVDIPVYLDAGFTKYVGYKRFSFAKTKTGATGRSMRNMGAWSSATSYVNDSNNVDIVTYNGATYMCAISNTNSAPNGSVNTNWTLLAANGSNGTNGTNGTNGSNAYLHLRYMSEGFRQDWTNNPYGGLQQMTVNSVNQGNNSIIDITSTGNDPAIPMTNLGSFDPTVYRYLKMRYKVVSGTAGTVEIFYLNSTATIPTTGYSATASLVSDNTWRDVYVDLWSSGNFKLGGNITGWRLDWASATAVNMQIDSVSLMSDMNTTGGAWVGSYTDSSSSDSTTVTSYTWTKIGANSYTLNLNGGTRGVTYAADSSTPSPSTSAAFTLALYENGLPITPSSASWTAYGVMSGTSTSVTSFTPTIAPTFSSNNTYVQVTVTYNGNSLTQVAPVSVQRDAAGLPWITDWNGSKVAIGTDNIVTPKIFAGKNAKGAGVNPPQLTGIAIGRDVLNGSNKVGIFGYATIKGVDNTAVFGMDPDPLTNQGKMAVFGTETDRQFIVYNDGSVGLPKIKSTELSVEAVDSIDLTVRGRVKVGGKNLWLNTIDLNGSTWMGVNSSANFSTILVEGNDVKDTFNNESFIYEIDGNWSGIRYADEYLSRNNEYTVSVYARASLDNVIKPYLVCYITPDASLEVWDDTKNVVLDTTYLDDIYEGDNSAGELFDLLFQQTGSGTEIQLKSEDDNHNEIQYVTTTWRRWSATFTIPTSANLVFPRIVGEGVSSSNLLYLSQPQLENGNVMTEWGSSNSDIAHRNSIISSINMSKENIAISASKIDIKGAVTFESLSDDLNTMFRRKGNQTVIDGSNIYTGSIGADKVNIYGMTVSGIVNGMIQETFSINSGYKTTVQIANSPTSTTTELYITGDPTELAKINVGDGLVVDGWMVCYVKAKTSSTQITITTDYNTSNPASPIGTNPSPGTKIDVFDKNQRARVSMKGDIQSFNYTSGSTGWKIDSTGIAEFNDTVVRGSVMLPGAGMTNNDISGNKIRIWAGKDYANRDQAYFKVFEDGTIIAEKGTFKGTVTGQIDIGNIHIADATPGKASILLNNDSETTVIKIHEDGSFFNNSFIIGDGATNNYFRADVAGKALYMTNAIVKLGPTELNNNVIFPNGATGDLMQFANGAYTVSQHATTKALLLETTLSTAYDDFVFARDGAVGDVSVLVDGDLKANNKIVMGNVYFENKKYSSTVVASPAPTTTTFTVAANPGFAVGQRILVDGIYTTFITAVATNAITVSPELPVAPSTGSEIDYSYGLDIIFS